MGRTTRLAALVAPLLAGLLACGSALAEPGRPASPEPAPAPTAQESVEDTLCRLIESSARKNALPVEFFTRLIWRESSFRADAVSPKGAQGIAQFMPGTAAERGLDDPFDPETALPASAALLADLRARFGSLGLAAAAYNAGPARVDRWLAGTSGLPWETQAYLLFVTGRDAQEWADEWHAARRPPATGAPAEPPAVAPPELSALPDCRATTLVLRKGGGAVAAEIASVTAPWGVQLAGNFSKARALASYRRAAARYAGLLEGTDPMIIGSRLRFRGARTYYRVRVGQPTRKEAEALCSRLRKAGGACVVFPS